MHHNILGRYQLTGELGRGGMATVYRAYDPQMGREVAIKILPRELLHDAESHSRFLREARTVGALDHPAIVPIYDIGEQDGQPYLVMRLMSGGSLAERIAQGPISPAEAARVIRAVSHALDDSHAAGVIHRDVKPANILFDQRDAPYISDFGIARLGHATAQLTGTGSIGTPDYMAPELSRPGGLTHLVDIYALGATLFEMFTGRPPFQADTPLGVLVAHITEPVPDLRQFRPDLPAQYAAIIARAMAKTPDERYQSAGALAAELELQLEAPARPTIRVAALPAQVHLRGTGEPLPLVSAPSVEPPVEEPAARPEPLAPAVSLPRKPPARKKVLSLPSLLAYVLIGSLLLWLGRATAPSASERGPESGDVLLESPTTPAFWQTSAPWPTPWPAPPVRPPLPVVDGSLVPLPYDILDAAYSSALDRLLLIEPDKARLIVLNPNDASAEEIALPKPATALAVSRDGARAAIGHDALVSLIDLRGDKAPQSFETSAEAASIVLADNGWIYLVPARDQHVELHAVEIATGRERLSEGMFLYAGSQLALAADGQSLYAANRGLSPSEMYRIDISAGVPSTSYDSPYHGDYEFCGDLWPAEDGRRIVTPCANVFRSMPTQERDMTYSGSLSPLKGVASAAFIPATSSIAALPRFAYADDSPVADQDEVHFFAYETLNHEGKVTLPTLTLDGQEHVSYGRHLFARPDGTALYVLVQAGRLASEPMPSIGYVPQLDEEHLPRSFGLVRLKADAAP